MKEGASHKHALNRSPEIVGSSGRVVATEQDERIARTFGARNNLVGTPWQVGSGAEKIVYHSNNPGEVIAIHKRALENGKKKLAEIDLTKPEARMAFIRQQCLAQIISILYPRMSSRILRSANRYGVTVNERIEGRNVAPMNEVIRRLRIQLRFRCLGLDIDRAAHNFLKSEQAGVPLLTYIDTIYERK